MPHLGLCTESYGEIGQKPSGSLWGNYPNIVGVTIPQWTNCSDFCALSGKPFCELEHHHFSWENSLFLSPCSIAMWNYQRVFVWMLSWMNRYLYIIFCYYVHGCESRISLFAIFGYVLPPEHNQHSANLKRVVKRRTYVCMYVRMHMYVSMYLCIYVSMYLCIYVCMYACMHVCMYACMPVCLYAYMPVCLYACMPVCMYACMHVCMYACMHVCMYACMHVCMYIHIRI